jgi:hypothetical protein
MEDYKLRDLKIVYYESMKRTKRSTCLTHTGLVVELEHLKIRTRLTNEKFESVKGECEI